MPDRSDHGELGWLCERLSTLHRVMLRAAMRNADALACVHPEHRRSAENLQHYTALRSVDLRPLQRALMAHGLSSLGRCEPWALGAVEAAHRAGTGLLGNPQGLPGNVHPLSLDEGRALLDARTDALFGARPSRRAVRVMVTMPAEAATDPSFVAGCLSGGMNAMRINTSSGGPTDWLGMIGHLRDCERAGSRPCRVFADLAGPKIRVSEIRKRGLSVERVRLRRGDAMRLSLDPQDAAGTETVTVRVDPAALLGGVRAGHGVWFDDGKVGAEAVSVDTRGIDLRVTFAKPGGQRLRVGKGLNLPESRIAAPALTEGDRRTLAALWGSIDAVALSFVRRPEDVRDLRHALDELESDRGGPRPAVVLKIETREGFEHLPTLLLELLSEPVSGVMLARGDLAVECGFERMAEVQEELLSFAEAAHTPVIWATEVLGTLAKRGRPTRAEITDAAAAQRAECVMLNKGPEIRLALATLTDILERMGSHQRKKATVFRPLSIAVLDEPPGLPDTETLAAQ